MKWDWSLEVALLVWHRRTEHLLPSFETDLYPSLLCKLRVFCALAWLDVHRYLRQRLEVDCASSFILSSSLFVFCTCVVDARHRICFSRLTDYFSKHVLMVFRLMLASFF
jgi:hypothetical protein